MVDNLTPDDIDLETFLKSAGESFTDAQKALIPGLDAPVNMMLSNAELELKVAVSSDIRGKMSIRPISSADILRGGIDPGVLSTIRINFVSSIGEIKPQPIPAATDVTAAQGTIMPDLVGRTLDEATVLLKSGGWQFEPHAASGEEIAAAVKENRGRTLRQQPSAGQAVDKTKTTVHIWVDLGNIPVRDLDGIGIKHGTSLSAIGVTTVGEFSLLSATQVASALNISETRAQAFLDMAGLMSRLAVLGFRDEVVELLVKGAGIRSIQLLSEADPKELFRVCQEKATSGKVQVPRGFSFTASEVKGWIKTANSYLGK
jgi:hypothetical protein